MILQLEHVTKSYGSIPALRNCSFAADRDEIVAVLGPNGAGKTTALEIALGLRSADAGEARLFGLSPQSVGARRRIGVTPQESGFPDMLRVREILAFVAEHYRNPMDQSRVLEHFRLAALANRRAGALSLGESRRLAVAVAFVGNPELIVLDEPTTGLDVESRRELWRNLRAVAENRCVVFTTHYLEEAETHATRVVVLNHGEVQFDGKPQALKRRVGGRRVSYETSDDGRKTVTVDDADAYVRDLVTAGTRFSDLEVVRPSLEEAFLNLTGVNQ